RARSAGLRRGDRMPRRLRRLPCRMSGASIVILSGAKPAYNRPHRRKPVQFALLIYESPEALARRNNEITDPYIGAWRAYYKALVEAGVYIGGDALETPETGSTVRMHEGNRRVQDGPYADTKEQLAGFIILDVPSLDVALQWAGRCPTASAGV